MRIVVFIAALISLTTLQAQRISTGAIIGTNGFFQTRLPSNYLFPENSYYVYYTANDGEEKLPIHNQYANGFNGGIKVGLDYKRFNFWSEITGSNVNINVPVLYPTDLGILLEDAWSTMQVDKYSINFNQLLTVKLTDKANGPYALVGMQYAASRFSEEQLTLNSDISSGNSLFLSRNEMYGILYTNRDNYWNAILGAGYKHNERYWGVRYIQQLTTDAEALPLARYYQVQVVVSQMLNFQKLKKGHKIYIEE
jgi:hypothetical protein